MPLGDPRYLLDDPNYSDPTMSYPLQYADAISDSPDLASYVRAGGDVLTALTQQLMRYRQAQLDDTLIRQQIERAQRGLPPVATTPGSGFPSQLGGSAIPWGTLGLLALGVGAVLMLTGRRGRRGR